MSADLMNVLIGWIHLSAAFTWIGSLFFSNLILLPWLERQTNSTARAREIYQKFDRILLVAFILLAITGMHRAVFVGNITSQAELLGTNYGFVLMAKLTAAFVGVIINAYNSTVLAPKLQKDHDELLRKRALRNFRKISMLEAAAASGVVLIAVLLRFTA